MIVVTVMYPEKEGATFDMDYYLSNHLKLVGDKWGGMGLKGARLYASTSAGAARGLALRMDHGSQYLSCPQGCRWGRTGFGRALPGDGHCRF